MSKSKKRGRQGEGQAVPAAPDVRPEPGRGEGRDTAGMILVDFSYLAVGMVLLSRVMLDLWPKEPGFFGLLYWLGACLTFGSPLLGLGLIRWWSERRWPGHGHETMLAFGLGLLILLRPWRDGVTFPKDNTYFLWGTVLLFLMWATRLALRGGSFRFRNVLWLLAAFMAVVFLTCLNTIQLDETYRTFLFWSGYALLFVLACNALRSRRAIGIVLTLLVVALFAESFHSLIHLKYYLPRMRVEINEQPQFLSLYFRTDQLTPELRHRLESNRAFGSFLFANALAAYLILLIPLTIGATFRAWRRLFGRSGLSQTGQAPTEGQAEHRRLQAILVGFLVWFVVFMSVFIYYLVFSVTMYELPREGGVLLTVAAWIRIVGVARWMAYIIVFPLLAGVAPGYSVMRYGAAKTWGVVQIMGLPFVALLSLVTLWLTYSRGGLLALALATLLTAVLLWLARSKTRTDGDARGGSHVAALALFALAAALFWNGRSAALSSPRSPADDSPILRVAQAAETTVPGAPQSEIPQAPKQTPGPPAPEEGPGLNVEGTRPTLRQLSDPTSLRLRMSYWRTGLAMAKEHLFTGVGLGNFRTAYPKYQLLGAGDVQQAHNDPIQLFAETGIFGLFFFGVFWVYVLVWGARRIVREPDPGERWLLAGIYTGMVAFLAHACVDFNFFNPSLAAVEFFLAGIFFARASVDEPSEPRRPAHQVAAVVLLVLAALIAGASVRVYRFDSKVGNRIMRDTYLRVGEFFLRRVNPETYDPKRPPAETAGAIKLLIPDRAILESFGTIQAVTGPGGKAYRKVESDEEIPLHAVLVITNPALAQTRAREAVEDWLGQLQRADSIYPHSPEIASYFFQWYDMLAEFTRDEQDKRRFTLACEKWAQESVDRSPEQFIYRECLAKALWRRGTIESGAKQLECYREGLEQYKQTALLYPIEPLGWDNYRQALERLGKAFIDAGDAKTGQGMLAEAAQAAQRSQELREKREELARPQRGKPK